MRQKSEKLQKNYKLNFNPSNKDIIGQNNMFLITILGLDQRIFDELLCAYFRINQTAYVSAPYFSYIE